MSELVERYVHQVGRYLPKKERADIEAELRSLIQDQLDDRFGGSPSQADVATVLAEFGKPSEMAASYNRDQYLVGPDLYPYMMMVMRYVWVIIPTIVLFLNLFGALIDSRQESWLELLVETLGSILQTTLIAWALVVLIFAILQHVIAEIKAEMEPFNPVDLPKVDDPHSVDRFETIFGIVFGAIVTLIFVYFLHVGGLTLRFNLSDPGDVIPVPPIWLLLLILDGVAMLILSAWVVWRARWTVGLWVTQSILEVFGNICMYFVIYKPVWGRIVEAVPSLAGAESVPEAIVIIGGVLMVVGKGSKLVALLNDRGGSPRLKVKRSG
jgi:hypothetical protein